MKEPQQAFAFTKDEIVAAKAVSDQRELSIGELASKLHSSEGWASRVVKSLENKGIVEKKRAGMMKLVTIAEANYAHSLAEMLRAEPYVPWEKVLPYSNIAVLLAKATSISDFEEKLSATTRWRALRNLSMHGLVPKAGGNISPRIKRFAMEYADHITQRTAQEILPANAVILWRRGSSYLFKIRDADIRDSNHFQKTAISLFSKYGIPLVANDTFFYYSPENGRLPLEDVVLHTVLIDQGSQTYTTYALLLIYKERKKINFEVLLARSERYDLRKIAEDIIRYVNTKGKERDRPLPRWQELKEQARLYRIGIDSDE